MLMQNLGRQTKNIMVFPKCRINKFRTKLYLIDNCLPQCDLTTSEIKMKNEKKMKNENKIKNENTNEKRNSDTLSCGCAGNEFCDDDREIFNS